MDAAGRSRWLHPRRKLVAGAAQPSRGGVVRHIQRCQPVFLTVPIFQPGAAGHIQRCQGLFYKGNDPQPGVIAEAHLLELGVGVLEIRQGGEAGQIHRGNGALQQPQLPKPGESLDASGVGHASAEDAAYRLDGDDAEAFGARCREGHGVAVQLRLHIIVEPPCAVLVVPTTLAVLKQLHAALHCDALHKGGRFRSRGAAGGSHVRRARVIRGEVVRYRTGIVRLGVLPAEVALVGEKDALHRAAASSSAPPLPAAQAALGLGPVYFALLPCNTKTLP